VIASVHVLPLAARLCDNGAMRRLLLTLESPAANLALDEALLDWAEAEGPDFECLRVWESPQPVVVLGRSSRVDLEVNTATCAERGIPILRRSSGGAAIVAGPGCLMYAVVLSYDRRPQTRGIPQAHTYVMERFVAALRREVPAVERAGTSDLVIVDRSRDRAAARKFSGNSLRMKRSHLLYHGTLLDDFDLSLIATCLGVAPRQPTYRESRDHADFVCNLPLSRHALENAVQAAWPTDGDLVDWPRAQMDQLMEERYLRDEWNLDYGRPTTPRRT
jgi:lipoate---protein ligase